MKIRIYSPFLPYPVTEGAYRVILDQAFSLLALGHEVELVTWKNSEQELARRVGLWRKAGWGQSAGQGRGQTWTQGLELVQVQGLGQNEIQAKKQGEKQKAQQKRTQDPLENPSHFQLKHSFQIPEIRYLGPQTDFRAFRILRSLLGTNASPESFYYPQGPLKLLSLLAPCDLAIYHYSFAHAWLKTPERLPREERRVVHFHNLESELSLLQAENSRNFAGEGMGSVADSFAKVVTGTMTRAVAGPIKRYVHQSNFNKLKAHESELLNLAQELWFLSPIDLAKFQSNHPSATLRLVPPTFSAEIAAWTVSPAEKSGQPVLGFIGGFDFQPNIDSAKWILSQLVPELEKAGFRGKVQFAGKGAQAVIPTLGPNRGTTLSVNSPIVEVLPDNFNTDTFFEGLSWMLVPHLSGSGVRIKLLDALSKKIPVMATPSAVERLHPEIQDSPLILSSDDPMLWVNQALQETAQATRYKFRGLAFPQAMSGMEIYRDV